MQIIYPKLQGFIISHEAVWKYGREPFTQESCLLSVFAHWYCMGTGSKFLHMVKKHTFVNSRDKV
jgi:hypothetical protein